MLFQYLYYFDKYIIDKAKKFPQTIEKDKIFAITYFRSFTCIFNYTVVSIVLIKHK